MALKDRLLQYPTPPCSAPRSFFSWLHPPRRRCVVRTPTHPIAPPMRTAAKIRQAALAFARRYYSIVGPYLATRTPYAAVPCQYSTTYYQHHRPSGRTHHARCLLCHSLPRVPLTTTSPPRHSYASLFCNFSLPCSYLCLVRSLHCSPRPCLWLVRSLHSSPSLFLRPVLCAPEYVLRRSPCRLHDLNVLPAVDRELQRRQRRVLRPRHTVAASRQQRCHRRVVPAVAGIPRGDRPQAVEPEPTPPPPPPCRCSFRRVLDGFRLHAAVPAWVGEQVLPSRRRERLRVRPSAPALPG